MRINSNRIHEMEPHKKSTHGGAGRGQGRKTLSNDGEPLVSLNSSVTAAQKAKFREHLGSAWLRAAIDAAPVTEKTPGKTS
ncbi:hypothetical protein KDK82_5962 [Delftia sp. K82]|jgi:hypothetical protein|nr:hypothetical protein KDK82_5962 [Delftia sp. K82]